jgi:streptogramin lyase
VPNSIDPGTLSEFSPTGAPLSSSSGYTGGGLSYPWSVAIDPSGNVWTANEGNATVSKHSSNGTPLSGSGFTATGLRYPYAIAIDGSGNIFTANGNNSVTKFNSAGSVIAQFTGGGLDVPFAVALDASQNVWTANQGISNTVSKFTNSGTAANLTGFTGGGMSEPVGVAIDANGNAWIANFNSSSVSKLNSAGSPLSGAGYATPSFVSAVAVDGANTVWTANTDGSISHLSNSGTAISPATGYVSPDATAEVGVVIDASGNVWTTDYYVNSLFEYVGAASPAVVPLQKAVLNNKLGQRP